MPVNGNNDPVSDCIDSAYEKLTPQERFQVDIDCAVMIRNLRGIRNRSTGFGELGARELFGKLAIYILAKAEGTDEEETIWEELFGEQTLSQD